MSQDAAEVSALGNRPELWFSMMEEAPLGIRECFPRTKPYDSPAFIESPSKRTLADLSRSAAAASPPGVRSTIGDLVKSLPVPIAGYNGRLPPTPLAFYPYPTSTAPLTAKKSATTPASKVSAPRTPPRSAGATSVQPLSKVKGRRLAFDRAEEDDMLLTKTADKTSPIPLDLKLRISLALSDVHAQDVGPGVVTAIPLVVPQELPRALVSQSP